MRSRLGIGFLLIALTHSACGLFGNKANRNRFIDFASGRSGCLNEFGKQAERFLVGDIGATEWNETWECAAESLTLFKEFVSGSDPAGYTAEDLQSFARTILVTDRPVALNLVQAALAFKAGFLGGSEKVLRYDEVERLVIVFRVLKIETARLIPFLRARATGTSRSALLEMSAEVSRSFRVVAAHLGSLNSTYDFDSASAEVLISEVTRLFGWGDKSAWIPAAFAVKALLTGGSSLVVEGSAWGRLLELSANVGAPLLALFSADRTRMTGPNEYGEFLRGVVLQFRDVMSRGLEYHGGAIPLSLVDAVMERLPAGILPVPALAAKKNIRPLFRKLLRAERDEVIDANVVATFSRVFSRWADGLTHLEKIYEMGGSTNDGLSKPEFDRLAGRYSAGLSPDQRLEVARLQKIMGDFRPLFAGHDREITVTPMSIYSIGHMIRMHWIELAIRHAIESYATNPEKDRLSFAEVRLMVEDYLDTALALKVIDPTIPGYLDERTGKPQADAGFSNRRLRDGDLFQLNSNGDGFLSVEEGQYLLAFLMSTSILSERIREMIEPICGKNEMDPLDWRWMDADCFKREFFARHDVFFSRFPALMRHLQHLSPEDFAKLGKSMMVGGRLYGDVTPPAGRVFDIASYDVGGIAGLALVVEFLFARFDADTNGAFNVDEALNAAQVFKKSIKDKTGYGGSTAEAIFTYLLKYRQQPEGFWQQVDFLVWKVGRPFWSLRSDRSVVYEISGILSPPAPVTP